MAVVLFKHLTAERGLKRERGGGRVERKTKRERHRER